MINKRTPGQRAFDRCFLPIAAIAVIFMFGDHATTEKHIPVTPHWWLWFLFLIGLGLATLWVRALGSLIDAWNDPSAKVIRFSASACLIVFGLIVIGLLRVPFH